MKIIRYKYKAFVVNYSVLYNNQVGHWDIETNRLVYNRKFKTLCRNCSLQYTFRYTVSVNQFVSKKQFLKRFTTLHKRCDECKSSLYFLKFIKLKTNFDIR